MTTTVDNEVPVAELLEESLETLTKRVNILQAHSRDCLNAPGERCALRVCDDSRLIWDIVEGMLHGNIHIPDDILDSSLEAISSGIKAVSQMELPAGTPTEVTEHVAAILRAMNARLADLTVLSEHGKFEFFRRLSKNLRNAS